MAFLRKIDILRAVAHFHTQLENLEGNQNQGTNLTRIKSATFWFNMFQTNSRGFDQNVDFINKLNVEHHGWQTVAHKEGKSLTRHYTYPRMRQSL